MKKIKQLLSKELPEWVYVWATLITFAGWGVLLAWRG